MARIVFELTEGTDLVEALNFGEALLAVANKTQFKHIIREVKLE